MCVHNATTFPFLPSGGRGQGMEGNLRSLRLHLDLLNGFHEANWRQR